MKTIRKGISILVALAMIVTICAVESPKISQAGVKVIVGKKLNVEITDTDTIVVKGKAKAKSANKKIAKFDSIDKYEKNSNIHIKGMKVGKTTIKVKVGKSTKKIKVTVLPMTVSGVRVAKNSETSATVSWAKSKGATGYTVYRSERSNTGFKMLASPKGTSYRDNTLKKGKHYYYKIQSYGKKRIKSEELSNSVYVRTWELKWREEFGGNAVNENVWNYDIGWATGRNTTLSMDGTSVWVWQVATTTLNGSAAKDGKVNTLIYIVT